MKVEVIPRKKLDLEKTEYLENRTNFYINDRGFPRNWSYATHPVYIIVECKSKNPIGIICRDKPNDCIGAWWWIDSKFRGLGYMSEAVEIWAKLLKEEGVTGVGHILVDSEYFEASTKIVKKLKSYF